MFKEAYVDADWLLYTIGSISENNYIEVKDSQGNIEEYKNITTFKKTLSTDELETYKDDYEIQSKKRLKDKNQMSLSSHIIRNTMKSIKANTGAEKLILALGGDSNFRDRIALPIKYKGNRDNLEKPLLYSNLKDYLLLNHECDVAVDQEADDILSINQYLGSKDKSKVVVTLDKDNRSIPGYLYHPKSKELIHIEGFGYLDLVAKKSRYKMYGIGRVWEYYQWCCGDSIDNYHPQDLLSKKLIEDNRSNLETPVRKLSDSKFYEMTENLKTDKDWFQFINDLFYSWYKDLEWYYTWDNKLIENISYLDILQCYVDTAHMRRWENDRVDIKEVFKNQGII